MQVYLIDSRNHFSDWMLILWCDTLVFGIVYTYQVTYHHQLAVPDVRA